MGKLDGKVAFITGAGAGIGRASALLFAREGASVAIVEIDPVQGQETVDMILAQGSQAMLCQTDITDQQSVEQAVNAVLERFGQINILYNNAGGSTNLDD